MKFLEYRKKQCEVPAYSAFANGALSFGQLFSNARSSMSLSAVFACVEIISNAIAEIPININNVNSKGEKELVEDHPVKLAFEDALISKYVMMKNVIRDMYIHGNGFIYIHRNNGIVTKLQYMPHGTVNVIYKQDRQELYYLCPTITNQKIMPKDMIHIVKNTYDGVNGISILDFAKRVIKLADITEQSTDNYYASGCNVSGVLSVQGPVSDKQKEELKNNWRMTYGAGGDNQGGVVVLPGNMTYQSIGSSAADAQLIDARLYNLQEICRFFSISPTLLGDLSHNSYSTLEMTQLQFLTQTLAPIICLVETEFNRKLLADVEKRNFKIDLDESFLLKADKSSTATYYTSLTNSGLLTPNEARYQLGYGPIEGGDEAHLAYSNAESAKLGGSNDNKEPEETKDKNN